MPARTLYKHICFLIIFILATVSMHLHAQTKKNITNLYHDDFKISASVPAQLNEVNNKEKVGATANVCNTSTFYLRFTAGAGEKINVKEIQTLPDGNFLITGNIILPNLDQEGILCVMNNAGAFVLQQRIKINNSSTTIFSAKAQYNGSILIAGSIHSASDKIFVSQLNSNLSTNWTKVIDVNQPPLKVVLDIVPNNQLVVAAHTGAGIIYSLLDATGNSLWKMQTTPAGIDVLAGIGHSDYNEVSIVINCTRASKKVTDVITFNQITGAILASHTLGSINDEHLFDDVSSYSNRFITTGVIKNTAAQFNLAREIMYNSNTTETVHTYTVPLPVDFNFTSAHDNAGDAMGFCFPQQGKLVYIRHFGYYQTAPEYIRQYDVPVGSSITSVSRSLIDGGYIFGLNTSSQDTIILIKTDSIGIVAGCAYNTLPNNYAEVITTQNIPSGATVTSITPGTTTAALQTINASLTKYTDCNQQYCPPAPPDDTCLST
ncbi:hypothetical protein, partial [Ferruginibacter sp.]